MSGSPRLFAARVLLLHLLAFVALLIVAGVGVWSAYVRAQHQSVEETGGQLRVVAQQTARGIEAYYGSILESIRLINRDEVSNLMPPPPRLERPLRASERNEHATPWAGWSTTRATSATAPAVGRDRRAFLESLLSERIEDRATRSFLPAVWRQIRSRATHLIAVRTDTRALLHVEQRPLMPDAAELIGPAADWLRAPNASAVSDRYVVQGFAYTLVAVRFASNDPLMIVAVVAIDEVGTRFIQTVQDPKQSIGATLIDNHSNIVFATDAQLIGTNLERDAVDPTVRRLVRLNRAPTGGFERADAIQLQDGRRIDQAVIAYDPVRLPDNKSWTVAVSAPLADVGGVVNELFRGTLLWAPIVVGLFAAVMVSTAVTLLRVRSRLDRLRHHALTQELVQARQIQLSWLPKPVFHSKGLHIAAVNEPASHVSGDFYNYFKLPDNRVALVIGDVTGHGMAAAFLMATTQLIVRLILNRTKDLTLTMNEANRALCDQVYSGQFVTLQVLVLDREAGTMDVVNAGHPPPVILTRDGDAMLLETQQQIVLGVDEDAEYLVETLDLPPDCSMLLYTDGVVECRDPIGNRFSIPMLVDQLDGAPGDPAGLIERVTTIVNNFRKGEPLADDTSAVAVQCSSIEEGSDAVPTTWVGESV